MVRGLTRWPASARLALAVAWTLLFAAGLFVLDRALFGPARVTGWHEVDSPEAAAEVVGGLPVPPYVPEGLRWPPARILVRSEPTPDWWYALRGPDNQGATAWLGNTDAPPGALGAVAGCLPDQALPCPAGWRSLSTRSDGETLFLVTDLDPGEAARFVDMLANHPQGNLR